MSALSEGDSLDMFVCRDHNPVGIGFWFGLSSSSPRIQFPVPGAKTKGNKNNVEIIPILSSFCSIGLLRCSIASHRIASSVEIIKV